MEKSTVTDTRITLGVWDDWVSLTSRQAAYIKPGTGPRFLQAGLGFRQWCGVKRSNQYFENPFAAIVAVRRLCYRF